MIGDYTALTNFVRTQIIDADLKINHLKITRSAILSITRQFTDLGWLVELIEDPKSRHVRHQLLSPDGQKKLSMIGGKVYRHPLVTEQICRRKHLTKKMLSLAGLPVPLGAEFAPKEIDVATAYFKKMPKPVVVKPTDSGGSAGVTVAVFTESEFKVAWQHALNDGRQNSSVLIEEFVRGVELRAFVIGAEVVSVVARIQPFVVGDGKTRIDMLIEQLHEERKVHYRATRMPVVLDWDFVERQGFSHVSVVSEGEIVYLSPLCLPSQGAFLVDVTESVATPIKNIAHQAMDAIPYLEIAGVDLLVEDLSLAETVSILEVNTAASLDLHRYTTHGPSRAVDEDIVSYFHSQIL